AARGGLRCSVRDIRRCIGDERSRWLQLQAVSVESRFPLGVQAGIDTVRRLERRSPWIRAGGGYAEVRWRRARSDATASGQHVPDQAVVLAESVTVLGGASWN